MFKKFERIYRRNLGFRTALGAWFVCIFIPFTLLLTLLFRGIAVTELYPELAVLPISNNVFAYAVLFVITSQLVFILLRYEKTNTTETAVTNLVITIVHSRGWGKTLLVGGVFTIFILTEIQLINLLRAGIYLQALLTAIILVINWSFWLKAMRIEMSRAKLRRARRVTALAAFPLIPSTIALFAFYRDDHLRPLFLAWMACMFLIIWGRAYFRAE